jgi:hypothetical protein
LGQEPEGFMKLSDLTDEQQYMIELVRKGKNVLVDACIGSGKTTAIQVLCDQFNDKRILYLTYNRLLKIDAQSKILNSNATVTNYHGYVYAVLSQNNITVGVSDLLQTFNREKPDLPNKFDMIVIDEYQDIEQESADMLEHIKNQNPGVQIVAVGDMQQKIYDKTSLDVPSFMHQFLGKYTAIQFTKCFRLNADHAAMLGRVWGKTIIGVNNDCKIRYMGINEVTDYLSKQSPKDVLCLGSRTGSLSKVLNRLEDEFPFVYNKYTTYASIRDGDEGVRPSANNAIFTTYDGCKGLERPICVVFDFDETYWSVRAGMPGTKYEILRNIFCVAASRGKNEIIFVKNPSANMLTEKVLSTPTRLNNNFVKPFPISDMFDFKYKEDVERCFSLVSVSRVNGDNSPTINVDSTDALIDLSPCIGIWQEADYFYNYDIDAAITFAESMHPDRRYKPLDDDAPLGEKILYLTMVETTQTRYVEQVDPEFMPRKQAEAIRDRLSTLFDREEDVQVPCVMQFRDDHGAVCAARGLIDVIKDNVVYELKFVSELNHEHFLQLACYLIAADKKTGVLWNVKTNEMYAVAVKKRNRQAFLDAVVSTITKGAITKYVPAGKGASSNVTP